jgi:hypothetical protein
MGISAVSYALTLSDAQRQRDDLILLGDKHLWQVLGPTHPMGQPQQLLMGNLPGKDNKDRGFGGMQVPQDPGFMRAGEFARLLEEVIEKHSAARIPGAWVDQVTRQGGQYRVEYKQNGVPHKIIVDKVVIASGTGPPRVPSVVGGNGTTEVNVGAMEGHVVGGVQFLSPEWRMPGGKEDWAEKTVAVYGGSATASWAVEAAAARGMHVVLWFTRPGTGKGAWDVEGGFQTAFPAGNRNSAVRERFANVRAVLTLTGMALVRGKRNPRVVMRFKDKSGDVIFREVDLLVYALGQTHTLETGIGEMLARELRPELVAFYDRNFALGNNAALLAVGTPDRSLMIVGSAMSSAAGLNLPELKVKGGVVDNAKLVPFKEIAGWLPPAAQPPEGIAVIMASIEALNDFIPARVDSTGVTWNINFNTSNRTQIAAYLAQTTDLSPIAANLAVALIIRLRTLNTFGLTNEQVAGIVKAAERIVHEAKIPQNSKDAPVYKDLSVYIDCVVDFYTGEGASKHFTKLGIRGAGTTKIKAKL